MTKKKRETNLTLPANLVSPLHFIFPCKPHRPRIPALHSYHLFFRRTATIYLQLRTRNAGPVKANSLLIPPAYVATRHTSPHSGLYSPLPSPTLPIGAISANEVCRKPLFPLRLCPLGDAGDMRQRLQGCLSGTSTPTPPAMSWLQTFVLLTTTSIDFPQGHC